MVIYTGVIDKFIFTVCRHPVKVLLFQFVHNSWLIYNLVV